MNITFHLYETNERWDERQKSVRAYQMMNIDCQFIYNKIFPLEPLITNLFDLKIKIGKLHKNTRNFTKWTREREREWKSEELIDFAIHYSYLSMLFYTLMTLRFVQYSMCCAMTWIQFKSKIEFNLIFGNENGIL